MVPARRIQHRLGCQVSGNPAAVGVGVVAVRARPRLRRRVPPDHLLHERHRKINARYRRAVRARGHFPPNRPPSSASTWSPDPWTPPDGPCTLGDPMEARPQCLRDHLRRPTQPNRPQLAAIISYTGNGHCREARCRLRCCGGRAAITLCWFRRCMRIRGQAVFAGRDVSLRLGWLRCPRAAGI